MDPEMWKITVGGVGALYGLIACYPIEPHFLEQSSQLGAQSPLCIGEWNMQQFNMDFTCHAVYPECSAARIWEDVRKFQLKTSEAKHVSL